MVTGDEAACAEAAEQFPGVVTAAVKRGLGRNQAQCMSPERARKLIRERAADAVKKAQGMKPWKIDLPATLELTYYRSDYADSAATKPGAERIDARTVRRVVESAIDAARF